MRKALTKTLGHSNKMPTCQHAMSLDQTLIGISSLYTVTVTAPVTRSPLRVRLLAHKLLRGD